MKLEGKKLLFDVITAGDQIAQFTTGKNFEDYLASDLLRGAVERKFEIVGEALVRLRAKDSDTFQRINNSQQAIAFRNRLVHGYDVIDHQLVWNTIHDDLPALKAEAESSSPNRNERRIRHLLSCGNGAR